MVRIIGEKLYQWDTGRQVEIVQSEKVTVSEVHFSISDGSIAKIVEPYEENGILIADIPDVLLQSPQNLKAYEVVKLPKGKKTISDQVLVVTNRPKPDDYVFTEAEIKRFEDLDNRLKTLENTEYIQVETDPTVPAWAKLPEKPTYTAEEVGALPVTELYAPIATYNGSLEVNTVYTADLSGEVAFTLSAPADVTRENRIRMLANVAAETSIDWGTNVYYGAAIPFVNEGFYEFMWEYNPLINAWVAGATRIGQVINA